LYEEIKNNRIDENWLSDLENRDNIFPEMDYRAYL
jgi:1,4-alpha-glucan branching enzyme